MIDSYSEMMGIVYSIEGIKQSISLRISWAETIWLFNSVDNCIFLFGVVFRNGFHYKSRENESWYEIILGNLVLRKRHLCNENCLVLLNHQSRMSLLFTRSILQFSYCVFGPLNIYLFEMVISESRALFNWSPSIAMSCLFCHGK